MTAYYNEIDPYAAQWLRNLISAGHIASGEVDERSIEDIHPRDLDGYVQCHFFAGIGVWSLALRNAGWADDRPVWTGSCPCQPFSAAGQGSGFADERHLWPAFFHLISQHRPASILGEQVASKDADHWLELVQADLETLGHAFGAVAFPAASIGAPHIRDRTYWVAHSTNQRQHGRRAGEASDGRDAARVESERLCNVGLVANTSGTGLERRQPSGQRDDAQRPAVERDGPAGALADAHDGGFIGIPGLRVRGSDLYDADGRGAVRGAWAGADWIACRDGKWRPVEPGSFPLAHGAPARVGRLRAYGNAIVAPQAQAWIETVMEAKGSQHG